MASDALTFQDRFSIFEQLNLHQRCIDTPWGAEAAAQYVDIYWPEGKFVLNDVRHTEFSQPEGLKRMFDYAHSVFPLNKWFHTIGPFEITGNTTEAKTEWRWSVNCKAEKEGVVSTGTYTDLFEKRGVIWKCLERTISKKLCCAMYRVVL
ncbi:MAG: hypothetical protein ACRYGF_04190 [Janthinobacterium lividum]